MRTSLLLKILLSGALLAPGLAGAASFSYTSQTGSVIATFCESATQNISGLGNADVLAVVDVGLGDCTAQVTAESALSTVLGSGALFVSQQANATGVQYVEGLPFGAAAHADLDILFTLDEETRVRFSVENALPEGVVWQDFPHFWLANLDAGWSFGLLGNEPAPWECNALTPQECSDFTAELFSETGLLVPAGTYQFVLDAFASAPEGSCSRGCEHMGAEITLSIVPEPETAMLVVVGMALLAGARRRA